MTATCMQVYANTKNGKRATKTGTILSSKEIGIAFKETFEKKEVKLQISKQKKFFSKISRSLFAEFSPPADLRTCLISNGK